MVQSRGSCTDKNWAGNCKSARPCADANPSSGFPVVNADIANRLFCCGSVLSSSSSDGIKCSGDGPFPVPTGTVIPGVAALAAFTSSSPTASPTASTTACATNPIGNSNETSPEKHNNDKSNLAIGLGLGLPLGVIAATALLWGFWERKKRASTGREMDQLKAAVSTQNYQYAPVPQMQGPPPVEMGYSEHTVAELPPAGDKR
ncbi:hypothetical protein FE257_005168 [Aspergillus nanangensis]|uniref:Uncharacterized protein n=1 Tax=Aspergillus nanangensis TaxID=2582783 RepID=A0AAD4GM70_ASPNN|nr:hypothetical protein FE257_005168 [Aspergillus nanangensis]